MSLKTEDPFFLILLTSRFAACREQRVSCSNQPSKVPKVMSLKIEDPFFLILLFFLFSERCKIHRMRSTSKSVTAVLLFLVEWSRSFMTTPSFVTKKVLTKPQTNVQTAPLHFSKNEPLIVNAPGCGCPDCARAGCECPDCVGVRCECPNCGSKVSSEYKVWCSLLW